MDFAKFGSAYSADGPSLTPRPDSGLPRVVQAEGGGGSGAPRVDRTYKLYYGGAQKRPDANYCRVISDPQGKAFALVGEANRFVVPTIPALMTLFCVTDINI